jgi:hypothetical protein
MNIHFIFFTFQRFIMSTQPTFVKALTAGAISGGISAVLNNIYNVAHSSMTGFSIPGVIHVGSITGSSVMTALVGGIGYFVLAKFMVKDDVKKRTLIFQIGAIVLAVLSLFSSFGPTLPDGTPAPAQFAMLSAPMHIIAGVVAALVIPRFAERP